MKTLKQFAITLLLTTLALTLMNSFSIASAAGLSDAKFNVTESLSLDKEDQPQSYFQEDAEGNAPIVQVILRIIEFATRLVGSIAVILLIVSGLQMILSQGNQQKLDDAKEVLKYAIIGLVVTFLSFVLVVFVQSLFINAG